jgi:flagellar biosynthetic protein FliP
LEPEKEKELGGRSVTDALVNVNGDNIQALQILFLTTAITLIPSVVVMMTSFTRYIVTFSFLRSAMGTQQTPPNIVLIGMALFLTMLTMNPVFSAIKTAAYDPYMAEEISQQEFLDRAQVPLKDFMIRNTEISSLNMFCDLDSAVSRPADEAAARALPMHVIVPSFMTSELKRAFEIGFLLYIPFMLIDVVVSSALMSMGMIMLPPSMISTPFKLLLFLVLNGWELLFSTLIQGFH